MASGANNPIWTAAGAEKSARIKAMFSDIAPTYDRLNSILSIRLHLRWRRLAVSTLQLSPGATVLDLCSGTGDFVPPLRKAVGAGGRVLALDFAGPMIELGRRKPQMDACWVHADALSLPIPSRSLDAVTVGWGLRNLSDVDHAHREIARVLKPGGKFVSLDMAVPSNPLLRFASKKLTRWFVPAAGALFSRSEAYNYLFNSTQSFASRNTLEQSMRTAGFEEVGHRDLFFGNVCMHFGRLP